MQPKSVSSLESSVSDPYHLDADPDPDSDTDPDPDPR